MTKACLVSCFGLDVEKGSYSHFPENLSPDYKNLHARQIPQQIMLPAHFHDVTYDHIWSKILQELTKNPAQNTRAIFEH